MDCSGVAIARPPCQSSCCWFSLCSTSSKFNAPHGTEAAALLLLLLPLSLIFSFVVAMSFWTTRQQRVQVPLCACLPRAGPGASLLPQRRLLLAGRAACREHLSRNASEHA